MTDHLPPIKNVDELEEQLSRPSPRAIEALSRLDGDLIVLGVGGKMGPTLARMAKRAFDEAGVSAKIIGVSRFSNPAARERLENCGVETVKCDLLDEQSVAELPDAANALWMSGLKFGTADNPSLTWAMNCYAPSLVCRRYRGSRIVAFSSGNVYGLVPADSLGSVESDPLNAVGEYSMSAVGRERTFDYFSRSVPISMSQVRLNYATELRYGVLVDIALEVWAERPVDVSVPTFNVVWLSDANAMTLAAFDHTASPSKIINLAGDEILSVRNVAEQFGRLMNKPVQFRGEEGDHAYLNDGRGGYPLLGSPQINADQMIRWTADWVANGGENSNKPTGFQVRSGAY